MVKLKRDENIKKQKIQSIASVFSFYQLKNSQIQYQSNNLKDKNETMKFNQIID